MVPSCLQLGDNKGILNIPTAHIIPTSANVHARTDSALLIRNELDHDGSGSVTSIGRKVSQSLVISMRPKIAATKRRCSEGSRKFVGMTGGGGGGVMTVAGRGAGVGVDGAEGYRMGVPNFGGIFTSTGDCESRESIVISKKIRDLSQEA